MVSFILDAVLIVICLLLVAVSVKRGFVRTILSLVSSVAAVLLSVVFTPGVASFIYDKFMLSSITNGIYDTVKSLAGSEGAEGVLGLFENKPQALTELLDRYNVSDETVSGIIGSAEGGQIDIRGACEQIASPIASTISNVIAFVICFIVALIVLKIAIAIIDGIFKFPILNTVNKAAGLLLGFALAVVVIFIYSEAASHLVTSLGAVSPDLFGENVIDDTVIVKFFSEHNIFGLIGNVIEKGL